jgi:hypothetical protein
METKLNAIEKLNRDELVQLKGGEGPDYVVVVIDGKEVRIYI